MAIWISGPILRVMTATRPPGGEKTINRLEKVLVREPTPPRRHFAPVLFKGLQDQFQASLVTHEFVWAGPDGVLGEAVVTHLLEIFLGHDPRRAGGRCGIEH